MDFLAPRDARRLADPTWLHMAEASPKPHTPRPWIRCSYPQRWSMRIEILRRAVGEQLLARSYPSTTFRARLPHIAATITEWRLYVAMHSFKSVAQADWMKTVAGDCREAFLVIKDWPGIGKPPEGPQYEKTARYPVAAAHVETALADLDEILGRVHRFMFENPI